MTRVTRGMRARSGETCWLESRTELVMRGVDLAVETLEQLVTWAWGLETGRSRESWGEV